MIDQAEIEPVRAYLLALQDELSAALEQEDGKGKFAGDDSAGERGGLARPRVLAGGGLFERAAALFSHAVGRKTPMALAERRPELLGAPYEAVSISLIAHPANPYVPTAHLNLRCFVAGEGAVWWFGGGFDLTPVYGFREDALHWHETARRACEPFGEDVYQRFKQACDEYFQLPHRGECRGIGGLFFDGLDEPDFGTCFDLVRSVGNHFLPAYLPIVRRRRDRVWAEREREFQLYRRGRYVEFNLLYDRGTRFGLQAGARPESILASLPPHASWRYGWRPEPGSPEERLTRDFLVPRDWLGDASSGDPLDE